VVVVFGVNLFFPRFLWIQDEARYGEVTREMVTTGNYMVPTLDGEFYPDKPPLYFWALALQSKISGMNAFSFRLVTVLSLLGFAVAFFLFFAKTDRRKPRCLGGPYRSQFNAFSHCRKYCSHGFAAGPPGGALSSLFHVGSG
jgi:4-amino-4-deoxy-L-arabinose transferase-like glycosyltransferase